MQGKKLAVTLFTIFVFGAYLSPALVSAAGGLVPIVPDKCYTTIGGCQDICDLAQLAQNVLNDGIYIAVFLSAILFAWTGLRMVINVANPVEKTKAKQMFMNVFIGLVIILVAWLVVDVTMRTLVGTSILPWNSIC